MAVSRKTVTVLFADLADSTGLGERLDPEPLRGVLARWFDEARLVIERHGGTVEKFIGDAVMAVFGVPHTHEDDALRAVRAADELHRALERLNEQVGREHGLRLVIRVGVNTGEVVTGGRDGVLVTGDAVNVAKRLEEAARGGEVLVGELTELLSRSAATFDPLGPLAAKGKSWPVPVWRLVAVTPADTRGGRLDTPLVGRDEEVGQLRAAYERALEERRCCLFTLLGPAGIGKSRLASAFFDDVTGEATVLVGRCLAYGDGITFWPLTEILREAGGDDGIEGLLAGTGEAELVVERLAGVTGRAHVGSHETFWAVRRLFETLGRRKPLVVCFEDVHWAEPTFLDLIEYLAAFVRDAPMLLLCIARPELLDERPGWLAARDGAAAMTLTPLSTTDADALLDFLGIPVEARIPVAAAAEGNPLYVEQIAAMLAEGGYADGMFSIPPSIQALLTARLDRLKPDERSGISSAAVCGKEFWRDAIAALTPDHERDHIFAALLSLVRKELIRPHRSSTRPHDDAFVFSHVLIRDAAYDTVPKQTRARLHETFANWIADNAGDHAPEVEEIVGYHLEQAFKFRDQVGPVDDDARRLAERAGTLLGQAGHRAFARGDMPAAVTLLARAVALLPSEHAVRVAALPELGSALMRTGDFTRAEEVLTEALESAAAAGDKRLELRTLIEREFFRAFTNPESSTDELIQVAEQTIPLLDALGDELGLAKAWWLRSEADAIAGRWGARAERLERALVHARRAGDSRESSAITAMLVQALENGPMPADAAIRRCEELRSESAGDGAVEAAIASTIAQLNAMQGDFDTARRLYADAGALYDELGLHYLRACRRLVGARIEALAGERDAAIAELQAGYTALEEMGERGTRSTLAAYLAHALAEVGRLDEAAEFAQVSAETGALADVVTQAVWRSASAQVLAREGEPELAERHARDALELAESTDFLELKAMTSLSLADVLRQRRKTGEADALVADARRAYERKGNVVAAAQLSQAAGAR